jgi:alkylation response protein AidB-like acyl-CoA dehydrogenase
MNDDTAGFVLAEHDAESIAEHAASAEAAGFLHPAQQALLHERRWLTMLAPRACGGSELPLPQVVRLEEAVAAADGSTGWVLTLCAGAGWFAGFLAPEVARKVLATPRVCIGGSGAATGHADQEGAGFRITGSWDYASGAPMATHFTVNAVLRVDGKPLLDADGATQVRAFLVPASQVKTVQSWRTIGLRASASHGYRIDDQWVPETYGFKISPAAATSDGPLYRYPFYSLAYVTLAANIAGMAGQFIRLARACMGHRRHGGSGLPLLDVPEVIGLLRHQQQAFDDTRAQFYEVLDDSWAQVAGGAALEDASMRAVQTASLALVAAARRAVDELYPYCGLYAAREDSTINRVWRDLHTASQHALLIP